jgi:hypothetical protein
LKRVYPLCGILSILAGEGAMLLFYFRILKPGPVLPVVWVMLVTLGVYLLVHTLLSWQAGRLSMVLPAWLHNRYVYWMGTLFVLAMDFWAWEHVGPVFFGVPAWIAFFMLLSLLQTIGMAVMLRSARTSMKDL